MSEPLHIATARLDGCAPYYMAANTHHDAHGEFLITCEVERRRFEARCVDQVTHLRLARAMHDAGVPAGAYLVHDTYFGPDRLKRGTDWGPISAMAHAAQMPVVASLVSWRTGPKAILEKWARCVCAPFAIAAGRKPAGAGFGTWICLMTP
jgi:hypothetical protein